MFGAAGPWVTMLGLIADIMLYTARYRFDVQYEALEGSS